MSEATPDFTEFVAACGPKMLRVAWLLTGDRHQAEDLLQTALAKLWPRWGRIALDRPEAYLRKVLVTSHVSWWRRRWTGELPHDDLPEPPTDADPYEGVVLGQVVAEAVRGLPPRQRAVVVLRFFEDLSVEETAEVLRCSPGTVKSQTHRALAALRGRLPDRELLLTGGPRERV
ncbi:RNA polymerase sigma24 factor [Streptomyces rubellomurinus subsp. indigoferus]|uniref:RNA polymerase sigma24 factor n=1 Tax=Streptomyces rubellomurinus (strain ATCC 31215) TaxID=359131 RepID=A0A0F2TKU8_STRR3|nr:SigE family RNA polymerase sigma factor [Streptomyces rubellomurinus]KJS53662.1 RNA polymerase sigma24 factor [Streptomyces rubellomurinus subsp. indigoferus]KJS62347.1 RNA polymerase sigma24 factor [Streptomyces rubellomurinus]